MIYDTVNNRYIIRTKLAWNFDLYAVLHFYIVTECLMMTEKVETCVARVNANKSYLLIKSVFGGVQVLFVRAWMSLAYWWSILKGNTGVPSAASCVLELRVRIPQGAWKSACFECCVLSCWDPCDGPITRPEESYWVCCVWVMVKHNNEEALAQ